MTGSYYNVTAGAAGRVSVLADLIPSMSHIGIVLVPDSDASLRLFEELRGAALEQNLDVFPMPVSSGKDVDHVFELAKSIGVQGVVTVTAAEMFAVRKEVADAQNKYSLPTVMGSIGFPELGGLAKYGPEVPALWVKMTSMIDAILTKRVAPAELPLITVDGFQLDVNLDSARRLNVSIPGSILERAVRIISLDPK